MRSVGETVRIRDDLIPKQHYGKVYFAEGMFEHCGKEYTIETVEDAPDLPAGAFYRLRGGMQGFWAWSEEMFEPQIIDNMDDFEIDIKEVLQGLYV